MTVSANVKVNINAKSLNQILKGDKRKLKKIFKNNSIMDFFKVLLQLKLSKNDKKIFFNEKKEIQISLDIKKCPPEAWTF